MKYAKILVALTLVAAANALATWYMTCDGTLSPDGSKVAYLSNDVSYGGMSYAIYTVNAGGSDKVRFKLKGGVWGAPYFSPDCSKIAFINARVDFPNRNIFLVDVDGTNLKLLTAYGDDPFATECWPDERTGVLDEGLTFSPDGRKVLYCSNEFGSKDIFAINVDGTGKKRLTDFADGVFSLPGPLDVGSDGRAYLVDHDGPVLEFTAAGECARVIPKPYGEDIGGPEDVAVGANGDVFITYGDVYRYPADGSPGELLARGGDSLAVDAKGNVYVAGSKPPYIRRYSAEGKLRGEWGEAGSGPGGLKGVSDVAVGPDGRIYVADSDEYRVQVFTPEGEFVASFSWRNEVVNSTHVTLAVASNGDVYVADGGHNRIIYFKRVRVK